MGQSAADNAWSASFSADSAPAFETFFATKKGKPVACPSPVVPIADSHTHLTCLEGIDAGQALARDAVAGIDFVVTVVDPTDDARDPKQLLRDLDIWQREARVALDTWGLQDIAVPRVRLLVGCHPHNARLFDAQARAAMKYLLEQPVCAGIGEIGLDYHYDLSPREMQVDVFTEQLRLACDLDAPLSLHVREAHMQAARIMHEVGLPQAGCVMHCFDCDIETYRVFAAMGCHFGIGGAVTFKSMEQLREVVRSPECSLESLVSETDSPYMAPVPLRGTPCEPAYIALTCSYIADLRHEALGEEQVDVIKSMHDEAIALFDAKHGFSNASGSLLDAVGTEDDIDAN